MEEDLPHPDPDSQYSGANAHLEMLKDMLMTYNMYDTKKVGYVQGMSDLLSVVYAIMQDDSDAFWCFCGFMDRMVPFIFRASANEEIQFPDESNRHAKTTRDIKTTHSIHDTEIIHSSREIWIRRVFLFIPTITCLV